MKSLYFLHYGKCRIQSFWSLAFTREYTLDISISAALICIILFSPVSCETSNLMEMQY